MKTTDPMEMLIEEALISINEPYLTDAENPIHLDFYLIKRDIHIEVKRHHSPRISDQMSRAPNVIVAQGVAAVQMLADLIKSSK